METSGLGHTMEDSITMGMDTWYRNLMTRECMQLHLMEGIQCMVVPSNKLAEEIDLSTYRGKTHSTIGDDQRGKK